MPVYEYKCMKCGEDFEKLVFGSQEVTCPACDSNNITKKFSVFGMSGVEKPFAGTSSCSSCNTGKGSSCSSCK
jgi:putative FmdB family regulatory protein